MTVARTGIVTNETTPSFKFGESNYFKGGQLEKITPVVSNAKMISM